MNETKHGPKFLSLTADQRRDLMKEHSSLGHPGSRKFKIYLESRGADPSVISAVDDMYCEVCYRLQKGGKLPTPAAIHLVRDFNQLVGVDGVEWKNKQGKAVPSYLR